MIKSYKQNKTDGFTLVELLVVIVISSIIAIGSVIFVNNISQSEKQLDSLANRLAKLQKVMLIIEQDFQQIIARLYRNEYGDFQTAYFEVRKNNDGDVDIKFVKTGWKNPLGLARSDLQVVNYHYSKNKLMRYYWTVLDRAQDSQPVEQVLLDEINHFSIRCLNDRKEWKEQWVPGENILESSLGRILPLTVEITIDYEGVGEIKRYIELVDL